MTKAATGTGLLLVVLLLAGCSTATPKATDSATRPTKMAPAATQRRHAADVTDRLWAAGIPVPRTATISADAMAFGIECTITSMTVEGVELKIYAFGGGAQAQQAARQLLGAADRDSLVLDNLLIVVPKGEGGARILGALS